MRSFKVKDFKTVKVDRYIEGDLFFTSTKIGILIEGKIKTIPMSVQSLKEYVKRDEIKQMIDDAVKKGGKNE